MVLDLWENGMKIKIKLMEKERLPIQMGLFMMDLSRMESLMDRESYKTLSSRLKLIG